MAEKDWREIFQVVQADSCHVDTETPGECTAACLDAKELKCICRCGGRNHGANLRKNVQPLDQFNEPAELAVEVIAA